MSLIKHKPEPGIRFIIVLFWPLVIGIAFLLTNSADIFVAPEYRNWALAHLFLHAAPIFLYLVRFRHQLKFPFVEILAAFNIIHYALPVFFIQLEDFQLGILSVEAIEETFWCHAIFYGAFYILLSFKSKIRPVEFVPPGTSLKVLKYFGYITLFFYLANKIIGISAIAHIGYVGFFVYLGLFLNLWREKYLKMSEKIIFVVIVLYDFVERALGGLLAPFALLVLFIIISILMSKSSKWLIVISMALFVWFYSIFSTIKYEYRNVVWYSGQYSIIDKILLVQKLYSERELNQAIPLVNTYKGKDHMLWRFSYQLSAMSLVMKDTPDPVPYWEGSTYIPFISKFIPRFMWPDKPSENMGYLFGTTYRITSSWNTSTSINTPILPELYMNFGFNGLYIGCFILAFIYFLLVKWFNSRKVTFTSSVIGMAIVFPLMIWESNFSLIFGNLILITLTFFGLYRLIKYFTEKK
jgi:hypothetical protein